MNWLQPKIFWAKAQVFWFTLKPALPDGQACMNGGTSKKNSAFGETSEVSSKGRKAKPWRLGKK